MSERIPTPAAYGSGYCYYVESPGAEEPHILGDERTLDEVYAAAAGDVIAFRGIMVDGELPDGSKVKMRLGAGRVHTDTGLVVRYHDHFEGPETGRQSDDEARREEPPPRRPARGPSPFPSIG